MQQRDNLSDSRKSNLNSEKCSEFSVHFQKSILLSLLESGMLTQEEFEECVSLVESKRRRA